MKRLALNFGVMKKARLFGLAVLAVLVGANNDVWAGDYSTANSGPWHDPSTWVGGTIPSGIISNNDNITVKTGHTLTINTENLALSRIILEDNAHLIVNADLQLTGNGGKSYPITAGEGATVTIALDVTLTDQKGIQNNGNITIMGEGTFTHEKNDSEINGQSYTLTTNLSNFNTGTKNFTFKYLYLNVEGGIFTNNMSNNTLLGLTISGGTFVANQSITVSENLTLSGGTLQVASGKTLTATANPVNVSEDATISGPASGTAATLVANEINLKKDKTLAIDGIVNLSSSVTFTGSGKLKIANGGTLTIGGTPTLPENITIENGGTLNLTGNVTLVNNITIEEGGTLNLSGEHIYFANEDLSKTANITGAGTIKFSKNGTANVHRLTSCIEGITATYQYNQRVTYDNTCTRIIPGTYYNLTIDRAEMPLCGDVTVNNQFSAAQNMTLSCEEGKNPTLTVGNINYNNANRNLTFKVNTTITDNTNYQNRISAITVAEGKKVTFTGNTAINSNVTLAGDIEIAEGATLNLGGEHTYFATDDLLTQKANIIGDGKVVFTRNQSRIWRLTECQSCEFEYLGTGHVIYEGTSTHILPGTYNNLEVRGNSSITLCGDVTVNGWYWNKLGIEFNGVSGNEKITLNELKGDNNKWNYTFNVDATINGPFTNSIINLTVGDGKTVEINGNGTITGDLYLGENATLAIGENKILTLNRALNVENNATLTGEGSGGYIAFTAEHAINVKTGCTLTISGNISNNSTDMTLGGDFNILADSGLSLSCSTVNFTPTSYLSGSGTLDFTNSALTINSLTTCLGDNVEFALNSTITYGESSTRIIQGEYYNLTLNTAVGKNITLCNDVAVSGTLTWNNGRIVLDGHELKLNGQPAVGTGSANHMILTDDSGKLTYEGLSGSQNLSFFVGSYNSLTKTYLYAPVDISDINADGAYSVSLRTIGTSISGLATDLKRYWEIETNGTLAEGGALVLHYDANDDNLNYGNALNAEGKGYWKVYNGETLLDIASPFAGTITIDVATINATEGLANNDINGIWTAAEFPKVTTLYAMYTGDWDNPQIWTTDPTGKSWINSSNVYPTKSYDAVIQSPFTVRKPKNATIPMAARTVQIAEGATLDISNLNPEFNNVYGQGTLKIDGDFPTNGDYSAFMAAGGGTTEFYGNHPDADITQYEYNNLILNYDNDHQATFKTTEQLLNINGSLEIKKGRINFSANQQAIHIGGNLNISANGGIYIYRGTPGTTHTDTVQVGGNFINRGEFVLTLRDSYGHAEALGAEGSAGRGVLRFTGEENARFECYNTTKMAQILLDKGTDHNSILTVYSDAYDHFSLWGKAFDGDLSDNNENTFTNVYVPNIGYYRKPLGLWRGTIELTGKIRIESLSEGGGTDGMMFYIPQTSGMIINGPDVKVYVRTDDGQTKVGYANFISAGYFRIESGLLDARAGSGISFRGTAIMEINGGTVRCSQFRPEQSVSNGIVTYIQTGGTFIVDGQGGVDATMPAFYMPFAANTFIMTGGTIDVRNSGRSGNNGKSTSNGGAFVVGCDPRVSSITGGEIIVNTGRASSGNEKCRDDYLISCAIPLWNLTLRNDSLYYGTSNTQWAYGGHRLSDHEGKVKNTTDVSFTCVTEIKNDLTICSGVKFYTDGKDLTIGGDFIIEEGAEVYTGTSDFIFNGGRLQHLVNNGSVKYNDNSGFYSLTVNSGTQLQPKQNTTLYGTLTLHEDAELIDGAENAVYTLYGNADISGTHPASAQNGTILFAGNGAQTISGSGNGKLNHVNINKTGGTLQLIAPSLTITGNLRLLSNTRFDIGNNNLGLTNTANIYTDAYTATAFNANRMIITSSGASAEGLTRQYSNTRKTMLFPIGLYNGENYYYLPAEISYMEASAFGSVTTRVVAGAHPFSNADNSLKCYWITDEQGFAGANNITQKYWYNTDLVSGTLDSYVPARYHAAEWTIGGTAGVHKSDDMRYFEFNSAEAASGHYTCGDQSESAFAEITHLYSSIFATTEGGTHNNWDDPLSWTTTKVGDNPIFEIGSVRYKYDADAEAFRAIDGNGDFSDGSSMTIIEAATYLVPTATTAVTIGSDEYNHTIIMNDNGQGSASLTLADGSILNMGTTTNHNFPLVDIETYGAGKLIIGSAYFPSGDFVKFLGANGGTVEYQNNSGSAFTMPDIATCRNLVISGTDAVQFLAADIHIFDSLTVSGQAQILNSTSHKLTIDGNLNITSGQMLLNCTAPQTIIIGGDVKVFADAKFTTDGSNATTHAVQIGGNLNAEGAFYSPDDNKNRIELTFVGTNTAYVTGTGKISVRTIICDKGTDMSAYLIIQNSNLSSSSDRELLKIKNGTCQIDIGNGNEINLSTQRSVTVESTARLSIKSGTARVGNYNGDQTYHLILSGALEILGGKLYVGHESRVRYSSIKYSPAGLPSITISGGQLIVNGAIRRQDGQLLGSLIYNQTGGDVIVMGKNRATENSSDNNNLSLALFEVLSTGEFTMKDGTLQVYGVDPRNNEANTAAGDIFICASKANNTGGRIIVGNGTTATEQKFISNISLNNLIINPYATVGVYGYPLEAKDITIENHGNLLLKGHDLTIRHGLYNRNATTELGSEDHGFVVGSETQLTTFTGSGMVIGGVEGNNTRFAEVKITGSLALEGNHSNIQVDKTLTLTSGSVTDNGSTITLIGDVVNDGRFVSNTSAGGVKFGGETATQYIRGRGYGEFGSVIIANPQRVALNTEATINNKLTLSGLLYINVSRLTLGKDATIETIAPSTLDANHMILLNGAQEDRGVRKILPAINTSTEYLIPIGIEGQYTPAKYTFTENKVAGATFTVKVINYLNQNLAEAPSYYLKYYWGVTTTGFGEESDEHEAVNSNFSLTQQYTYTDALLVDAGTHGTKELDMLPEYQRTLKKYAWRPVGDGSNVDVDNNIITFTPNGHFEGEYTAGVVKDVLSYTELPYLYSRKSGYWDDPETWQTESDGCTDGRYCIDGHYNAVPAGNPVIIQAGDTVTVSHNNTKSYTLEFADLSSTLNVAETFNNDFGRVSGVGHIQMEATEERPFMFPSGDFDNFLNDPRSVVIFYSKERDGDLSKSPGTSSQPLQNVIIRGSHITKIMASDAWVINGNLTLENGATLDNSAYNTPIRIGGNWIDTAGSVGYIPGRSTVEFNGDSTQRILIKRDSPQQFYGLAINNSGAAGSDSVIIGLNPTDGLKSFEITQNLNLVKGYLIVDTTLHAPVLANTATAIGASAASFVSGPIGKQMSINGNFIFPIGNNGRYAATQLSSVSTGGVWMVDYVNNQYDMPDDDDMPIQQVSDEYWRMHAPTTGATAKIKLRYDAQTLPTVNKSNAKQLAKLTIVDHPVSIWNQLASTRSGSELITTEAQVAQGYENVYSIGYIGTTARFNETAESLSYQICDNGGKAQIPILFTGTPDYNLTYKVSYNGVEVSRKTVTLNGDGNMTISATDLGFRSTTTPYIVELVSVTDASGEGAIAYRKNGVGDIVDKAEIYVYYNALPEISGDNEVGKEDTRLYSVLPFAGAVAPYIDSAYSWTHTGAAVTFATAIARETDVTFDATGKTTLNAEVTYKYSDKLSCINNRDFEINVLPEPQPSIIAAWGLNACIGAEAVTGRAYSYSTTNVANHSYKWTVTGGTIKSGAGSNTCVVEWNEGETDGTLEVEEWVTSNETIKGSATANVKLYPVPSLADVSLTIPEAVCYGTGADVEISCVTPNYSFKVFNSDGTARSGDISGNGTFVMPTATITEGQSIYLVVKNDGCEKRTDNQDIDVEQNPDITLEPVPDLYVGKPAIIGYTNNNTSVASKYTFTYDGGETDGEPENISTGTTGTVTISVGKTFENLKGTLTITANEGLNCHTDYEIDEPVSQDYLWKGTISTDWHTNGNWWVDELPTNAKNARVLSSDVTYMPVVGAAAVAKDVIVGSGATVTVDAGKTLAINGNVDCAGEFLGNGTVTFTDAEHNVSGSSVTFANLTNNGTVTANNNISVTGTLNNAGNFTGEGAIVLSGSSAQTVDGSGTFTNVTINNANGVSVSNAPTFNGIMTLANGIVTPVSRINIGADGTMNQTGNSWVNGEVRKTWGSSKNKFNFVIGGAEHAAPIGIMPTTNNADFTASYSFVAGAEAITEELPEEMKRVSAMQTWKINGSVPSYLTLYWSAVSGVNNLNELTIAHHGASGWEMIEGITNAAEQSITSKNPVSSYSPFTFGTKQEDIEINPLPVTFASFTGRQVGSDIVLEWTTLSERNNDYFEIERSIDGITYVTIGFVNGAGNSNERVDYTFSDNTPEQGKIYYRLSQVDFDEVREYANKAIVVQFINSNLDVSFVPNPTSGIFTVKTSYADGNLIIMTQSGVIVHQETIDGFNQKIDISELAKGIYIAKYVSNGQVHIQKIVKL